VLLLRDDDGADSTTPTPIVQPGDASAGAAVFASAGCGGCHAFGRSCIAGRRCRR